MPAIIIVTSTGLMVYWISRMKTLMHDSEDQIKAMLEGDLSMGRRILSVL